MDNTENVQLYWSILLKVFNNMAKQAYFSDFKKSLRILRDIEGKITGQNGHQQKRTGSK